MENIGEDIGSRLRFEEVTPETFADFERLFAERGGPSYCWCMVWRDLPDGIEARDKESKREAISRIIGSRTPVGILGYLEDEPVAWCSVAPRSTHRKGLGGTDVDDPGALSTWSITCFYLVRRYRKQGIGRSLLGAAIDHARGKGAHAVEAYPVDPSSPSYLFMGFVPMFEQAGFEEIGMAGARRHVMRLRIGANNSS